MITTRKLHRGARFRLPAGESPARDARVTFLIGMMMTDRRGSRRGALSGVESEVDAGHLLRGVAVARR
jgi:hypothetical protein